MKGCEGVLNETHSTRYHEVSSLHRLSSERAPDVYTHAYTHQCAAAPTEITEGRIGAFR